MSLKFIIHNKGIVSNAFSFARYVHCLAKKIPTGGTGALWFRGQANEQWELKPSIGRSFNMGGLYDVYKWTITKSLVEESGLNWTDVYEKLSKKNYIEKTRSRKELIINPKFCLTFEAEKDYIKDYMLEIFGKNEFSKILDILQKKSHNDNFYQKFYNHEKYLLQRFKRDAYPFVERMLTDWEAITLGQHHGLPTRLLDWTSNPLVALFNATEKTKPKSDGVVFAYRPRSEWKYHISMFKGQNPSRPKVPDPLNLEGGGKNKRVIKSPYIKVVFPMLITNRLVAQSGGFTIQDPHTCLTKMGNQCFNKESLDLMEMYRWILPADAKSNILDQLHRVSVNRRTLFPDLDGVGHGLWKQEGFRMVAKSKEK